MHRKIKVRVNKLIYKYNTKNVYELSKCLNIKIFYHELGENIKGFYQKEGTCNMIHLNNKLSEFEEILVLAHEIGHAILHKETNICFLKNFTYLDTNKLELQANLFAIELLISDLDLEDFIEDNEYPTVENASKHFNIPQQFMYYKMNNFID